MTALRMPASFGSLRTPGRLTLADTTCIGHGRSGGALGTSGGGASGDGGAATASTVTGAHAARAKPFKNARRTMPAKMASRSTRSLPEAPDNLRTILR